MAITPKQAKPTPLVMHAWYLSQRMQSLGITQAELRKRINEHSNVTAATVSRWISARSYPSREVLRSLLNSLELQNDERTHYLRIWAGLA